MKNYSALFSFSTTLQEWENRLQLQLIAVDEQLASQQQQQQLYSDLIEEA